MLEIRPILAAANLISGQIPHNLPEVTKSQKPHTAKTEKTGVFHSVVSRNGNEPEGTEFTSHKCTLCMHTKSKVSTYPNRQPRNIPVAASQKCQRLEYGLWRARERASQSKREGKRKRGSGGERVRKKGGEEKKRERAIKRG